MGDTPHTYAGMTGHVHMDKGHPRPYPGHLYVKPLTPTQSMRKTITLLAFFIISVQLVCQAAPKFDPEAYRQEQRRYIIEKTKISANDAAKFFAIYDKMRSAERSLFDKIRDKRNSRPSTEAECRKAIIEKDNMELQLKKLQCKYHQQMLKVLPAKIVLPCLFHAEQFDRSKLRHMSQGNHKRPGKHPESR